MYQTVLYLSPRRRRPIRVGPCLEPDVQGRLPHWWCDRCGGEIFRSHCRLCRRCRLGVGA